MSPETVWGQTPLYQWLILPFLIFLARATDVAIGTVRIILIGKGRRFLPPLLGFIEILIWLLAIRGVFMNLTNAACYIAYAAGFAMGNYTGMIIEQKLAIGFEVVRVITKKDASQLIEALTKKGLGVTNVPAKGSTGDVNIIFTVAKRKDIESVLKLIRKFNPKAFYSIEDIRSVKEGIFPVDRRRFFGVRG